MKTVCEEQFEQIQTTKRNSGMKITCDISEILSKTFTSNYCLVLEKYEWEEILYYLSVRAKSMAFDGWKL